MALSVEELKAIGDEVQKRLDADSPGATGWLKNAGEAVGLVAGFVALGYFLGAGVVVTRLFVDKFAPDEVVGVIGELPRTFVITLGYIEGFGVALAVGVLLGAFLALVGWPKKASHPAPPLIVIWLFAIACFVFVVVDADGWRRELWILVPLWLLSGVIGTLGLLALVRGGELGSLAHAGVLTLLITAIGIPLCVMFSPIVGFPSARICLRATQDPLTGTLVANTEQRAVLIRQSESERNASGDRTVDTIPADLISRLDYGDLADLPPCPPPSSDAG